MATTSLALLKKGKSAAAEEAEAPETQSEEAEAASEVEETTVAETAAEAPAEQGSEDDEEVTVDVDKMTIPELDALVKEHGIEVPETWWKQVEGVKKMTGPEKKAWLKEQFEDDGSEAEEAADPAPVEKAPEPAPAKAEEKAPEPTTKAAKKASKEIAQAKAPAKGEIVEPDELSDMVHEIENLKEKEARALAAELNEHAEFTFFKLGGVLSVIQANGWFTPYPTFRDFVEQEHGIHYRKAMYLVGIYNDMTAQSIPWKKVKHLGWTKMSVLSPILTPENLGEWIALAEQTNVPTLTEMVKKAKLSANGTSNQLPNEASSATVVTKTFKLHEDQKETVEAALSKAKEDSGTDVDTVALEFICLDFLGSKKKAKPLSDQLKDAGIDAALEALNAAFPNTDFSVEVNE